MRGHSKRPGPSPKKEPRSPDRTKLWYIYLVWENNGPLVIAAEQPQKFRCLKQMRIRAITGRAAARVYIRHNLAFDLTCIDQETDNPCSPSYGSRPPNELIKKRERYKNKATIHVIKKGNTNEGR